MPPEIEADKSHQIEEIKANLWSEFIQLVFSGDGDLRTHGITTFFELCHNHNINPISFQLEQSAQLDPTERLQLVGMIPKGARIELHTQTYYDGGSPSNQQAHTKLLNLAQAAGQPETYNSVRVIQPSIDGASIEEVPQAEVATLITNFQSPIMTIDSVLTGIVLAEQMQGYSQGLLILEEGSSEPTDCILGDVTSFAITDIDLEKNKRREREIYPGRLVQVWDDELQRWFLGSIDSRPNTTQVTVSFAEPIKKPSIYGDQESISVSAVKTEVTHNLRLLGTAFPVLGNSEFESHPDRFPTLDLSADKVESPFHEIPTQFRPGTLLYFTERAAIGEVESLYLDGTIMISGIDATLRPTPDSKATAFTLPQLLTLQETQKLVPLTPDVENSKLYTDTVFKLKNPGKEALYVRGKGVFQVGTEMHVVFESLPVKLGEASTRPNANRWTFSSSTLANVESLIAQEKLTRGDDPLSELRTRFPDQWQAIMNALEPDGSTVCRISFSDPTLIAIGGDGTVRHEQTQVYFHSLPFGVWVFNPFMRFAELIKIEDILELVYLPPEKRKNIF